MATTEFTYARGSLPTAYPPRPSEGRPITWMTTQTGASHPHESHVLDLQANAAWAFMEIVGTVYLSPNEALSAEQVAALPRHVFQQLASRISLGLTAFLARGGSSSPSPTASISSSIMSQERIPNNRSSSSSRSIASARSSTASNRLRREAALRAVVEERDSTCVISGELPDASQCCHIFAHSLGGGASSGVDFLSLLHMLCGPARVAQVQALLGGSGQFARIDCPENCIFLSATLHINFGSGRLALLPRLDMPVGRTAAALPGGGYDHSTTTSYYVEVAFPFDSFAISNFRTYYDDALYRSPLMPEPPSAWIPRGTLIQLATRDPQRLPLPHPLLLDIHYTLSCVLGAKAQADAQLVTKWEEDDDITGRGEVLVGSGDTALEGISTDSVTRVGTNTSLPQGTTKVKLAPPPTSFPRSLKATVLGMWKAITGSKSSKAKTVDHQHQHQHQHQNEM
ncbi:hypothetical protein DFH27DRAFT_524021 [Peziza echinospora]|nr:hypothetical protein DFH27DRAFT_524021 [Peziza echinospora]